MIEILVKAQLTEQDMKSIAEQVAIINSDKKKSDNSVSELERQYTVNEIARLTKKKPWTIREHTKAGLLKASKVGKSWLISESNYLKYINNSK